MFSAGDHVSTDAESRGVPSIYITLRNGSSLTEAEVKLKTRKSE